MCYSTKCIYNVICEITKILSFPQSTFSLLQMDSLYLRITLTIKPSWACSCNNCRIWNMMTSSNGIIFRVTGPLCGEFTGRRWIPLTKELFMFSFICAWISGWVNNHKAGDLRRHRVHYDVTVMNNICPIKCVLIISKHRENQQRKFRLHALILVPTWISNLMISKMWDGLTYQFPNLNSCNVEDWKIASRIT